MLTAYPSLNDAEFAEACKALEQRCYDNLSGTNWLSIHWHGSELEIKQMKPATNGETEAIPQSGAEVDPEEALAENDNVVDALLFYLPPQEADEGPRAL